MVKLEKKLCWKCELEREEEFETKAYIEIVKCKCPNCGKKHEYARSIIKQRRKCLLLPHPKGRGIFEASL